MECACDLSVSPVGASSSSLVVVVQINIFL